MPTALPVIESGLLSSSGLVQSSDSGGDRIPIVDHFAIEPQHAPALKDGGIVFFTVVMKTGSSGCLLYTSPSPRDRTRSRMPSSA